MQTLKNKLTFFVIVILILGIYLTVTDSAIDQFVKDFILG